MTDQWRGIYKLIEELGELQQVLGKLGNFPDGDHPDGDGNLIVRLNEELTDVQAAMDYFMTRNNHGTDRNRYLDKINKFTRWDLPGIKK